MAQSFYVAPGGDLTGGLTGLSSIVANIGEEKEKRRLEAEKQQYMQDAQVAAREAYRSGDPDLMMEVGLQYPEYFEQVEKGVAAKTGIKNEERIALVRKVRADPANAERYFRERIQSVTDRGGDPSDSIRALEEYLQNPEAKLKEMEMYQASMDKEGYEALKASQAPVDSKVVGDFLVNGATGEILFNGGQEDGTPEHGVTPLIFKDPITGKYTAYLPNKAGGMTKIDTPEGQEFVPDSGRMGYNPANIMEQGVAKADTQLQTAPVTGEAARQQALAESRGQRATNLASREDQAALLNEVTNDIKSQSGTWTTGFLGDHLKQIPGTDAANLAANLDTLLAAAGFAKLQEMRDSSPTGGALGQVTERELALLQATWGSIQQSQSKEQFDKNLDRFQKQVNDSWDRVNQAYQQDYGQSNLQAAPATSAAVNVTNQAEFDALPSGAIYLEDGVRYRKP